MVPPTLWDPNLTHLISVTRHRTPGAAGLPKEGVRTGVYWRPMAREHAVHDSPIVRKPAKGSWSRGPQ